MRTFLKIVLAIVVFCILFLAIGVNYNSSNKDRPLSQEQSDNCANALMNKGYSPQNYDEQAAWENRVESNCRR